MYEDIIGESRGWHRMEYTWRDSALYAMSVGELDDLYTFEKGMKALPSFGVLPYFNGNLIQPQENCPHSGNVYARELLCRRYGDRFKDGLHMTHELIMNPGNRINPIKGTLLFNDTITGVWDRGPGKGMMVETTLPVYDESGQLLCTNISKAAIVCDGGWGGPAPDKGKLEYPDREPDKTAEDHILKFANKLYRLTGDTNYLHIDRDYAKSIGYEGPVIMQGLAQFGLACRMLIDLFIPGEPERMTRMLTQFRAAAHPDTDVRLLAWKMEEGKIWFRLMDVASGKAILDNSIFEYL